jgi:hypothetical protein
VPAQVDRDDAVSLIEQRRDVIVVVRRMTKRMHEDECRLPLGTPVEVVDGAAVDLDGAVPIRRSGGVALRQRLGVNSGRAADGPHEGGRR